MYLSAAFKTYWEENKDKFPHFNLEADSCFENNSQEDVNLIVRFFIYYFISIEFNAEVGIYAT